MLQQYISGLAKLADKLNNALPKNFDDKSDEFGLKLSQVIRQAEIENSWFTADNVKFALQQWADILREEDIKKWLAPYDFKVQEKRIGLILAGNIPLVGFHDVICVILSGNTAVIKLSSKDKVLIPFFLENWSALAGVPLQFEFAEKLTSVDALIATGSNNTARYLAQYFKQVPNIIRKNRTSVAVLSGQESDGEIQELARDIFTYFGKGCRNVTHLFLPLGFELSRLFENFLNYSEIINHHAYANNYDYNKAIFLLNQDNFWDNNFIMLRENDSLFSPLGVLNFTFYDSLDEVKNFLAKNHEDIQATVSNIPNFPSALPFGHAQHPALDTYADGVNTLEFLAGL